MVEAQLSPLRAFLRMHAAPPPALRLLCVYRITPLARLDMQAVGIQPSVCAAELSLNIQAQTQTRKRMQPQTRTQRGGEEGSAP